MTTIAPSNRLPALFLSHGSPMVGLQDDEYTHALRAYAESLPLRPRAIVVVSAHGLSEDLMVEVSSGNKSELIYDFAGFPKELYQLEYPCPGAPELASQISALLMKAGFKTHLNPRAGMDHGVWVPLRILFPEADIPVVQVSMPYPSQPERVLQLGRALASLRDEGVLLIGSGGLVHNLGKLVWHQKSGPTLPWAAEFETWVHDRLEKRDVMGLLDFQEGAPLAKMAHPTAEHFYPIFFTLGASATGDHLVTIYQGTQYASLSMSCFALTG